MKIEEIETFIIQDWVMVRVQTDSGISGIGEATFHSQSPATVEVVRRFREYLVGKDPLTMDHHWQYLYRSAHFRSPAICAALSAIDTALWDIAGKHYGAPVYTLLGGKHRDKVRMCALTLAGDFDTAMDMVAAAVKEGYTAVKIDPLPGDYARWSHARLVREVVNYVGAVREAVGDDVDVCVEAHRKLAPFQAVALAEKLEPLDILFLEDPLPPDSIDSMAEVARKVRVPISTGERLHSIYEFKEVLAKQAAQDIKLDVGLHGGFSQCKKIAGLAEAFHATVSPHNALGPVLTAAHVQLAAAIPNFQVLEYRPDPKDDVVKLPLKVEHGYIKVPEAPGIGLDFDEDAAAKYPYVPGAVSTAVREDGSVAFS